MDKWEHVHVLGLRELRQALTFGSQQALLVQGIIADAACAGKLVLDPGGGVHLPAMGS